MTDEQSGLVVAMLGRLEERLTRVDDRLTSLERLVDQMVADVADMHLVLIDQPDGLATPPPSKPE